MLSLPWRVKPWGWRDGGSTTPLPLLGKFVFVIQVPTGGISLDSFVLFANYLSLSVRMLLHHRAALAAFTCKYALHLKAPPSAEEKKDQEFLAKKKAKAEAMTSDDEGVEESVSHIDC